MGQTVVTQDPKNAPKPTSTDFMSIRNHADLIGSTTSKIKALELRQMEVLTNPRKAKDFTEELRKIYKRKISVRDFAGVARISKHYAEQYCSLAQTLKADCNGRADLLTAKAKAFVESEPPSVTFFRFVKFLKNDGKGTGPKPDRVQASISGLSFSFIEGEAKPPKEYTNEQLDRAIKTLEGFANQLKTLRA